MDEMEVVNGELLTPSALEKWLKSLDQTPRVLVVVHPDGYCEAFGINAQVKVVELWTDQSPVAAWENLNRFWREVWYPRLMRANGMPRKGTWREMKLMAATIRECCEAAKLGARADQLPALDSLAGVFETDIPSIVRAAKQLREEGLI